METFEGVIALTIFLCRQYGRDEIRRLLLEIEEKAECYSDGIQSLHIGHEDEFEGG